MFGKAVWKLFWETASDVKPFPKLLSPSLKKQLTFFGHNTHSNSIPTGLGISFRTFFRVPNITLLGIKLYHNQRKLFQSKPGNPGGHTALVKRKRIPDGGTKLFRNSSVDSLDHFELKLHQPSLLITRRYHYEAHLTLFPDCSTCNV